MTPEQYKPGLRVWYEPSPGIRFLGETVGESPRLLGSEWVSEIHMTTREYGKWRNPEARYSNVLTRMSVPAAALICLHPDV